MKRLLLIASALAAGCTSVPSSQELDVQAQAVMKASFRDHGIAKVDRLEQDLGQQACSSDKAPAASVAKEVEQQALAGVRWPSDGRWLGDWKEGERLAQNGRGLTWNEPTVTGNGGGCYNCHQIGKAEISFGNIGPSLYQYGKLRGVKDAADPAAEPIVRYTWGKLWNSKAYVACSNMPRFGHAGILTEAQIRDVMALLLDPKSPVNQ